MRISDLLGGDDDNLTGGSGGSTAVADRPEAPDVAVPAPDVSPPAPVAAAPVATAPAWSADDRAPRRDPAATMRSVTETAAAVQRVRTPGPVAPTSARPRWTDEPSAPVAPPMATTAPETSLPAPPAPAANRAPSASPPVMEQFWSERPEAPRKRRLFGRTRADETATPPGPTAAPTEAFVVPEITPPAPDAPAPAAPTAAPTSRPVSPFAGLTDSHVREESVRPPEAPRPTPVQAEILEMPTPVASETIVDDAEVLAVEDHLAPDTDRSRFSLNQWLEWTGQDEARPAPVIAPVDDVVADAPIAETFDPTAVPMAPVSPMFDPTQPTMMSNAPLPVRVENRSPVLARSEGAGDLMVPIDDLLPGRKRRKQKSKRRD